MKHFQRVLKVSIFVHTCICPADLIIIRCIIMYTCFAAYFTKLVVNLSVVGPAYMNTEVLQCLREATVFQDEGILDTLLECLATPPATTTIRVNTISYSREEVVGRLSDILTQVCRERHGMGRV